MIINSLLDLDFYKLTMAQVALRSFRWIPVTYSLTNRTKKVRLAELVPEADLRRELDHVRRLRFRESELRWLRRSRNIPAGLFQDDFLEFLRGLRLPPYFLAVRDGQYVIEVAAAWPEAILWETIILAVVNELYYRVRMRERGMSAAAAAAEGRRRLGAKMAELRRGAPGVKFIEFGTRRRFSRRWQAAVVEYCRDECPEMLLGTSNVLLARRLGLRPIGTFAHEMFMVLAASSGEVSDRALLWSHCNVLNCWWEAYGEPLSIALTDTFGTDFFFRDFTAEQAGRWRGLRQDSGDPAAFGERAIAFYRGLGIDPAEKLIVFSDGLDVATIVALENKFRGRIRTAYGWGTNLTNDCGFDALSLVVKAREAGGRPTVKLSDNVAKAMGPAAEVERYKRVFRYSGGIRQDCVY